jgi:hypothetical protein
MTLTLTEVNDQIKHELEQRRLNKGYGWHPPVTHLTGSQCRQSEYASAWNETSDQSEVSCLNCLRYMRKTLSGNFFVPIGEG